MGDSTSEHAIANRACHSGIVIVQNLRVCILDKNHHPNIFLFDAIENDLEVSESDPGKSDLVNGIRSW